MTAKELIKKINSLQTVEEAKTVFEEEQEWIKSAPAEEVAILRDSGCAEIFYRLFG